MTNTLVKLPPYPMQPYITNGCDERGGFIETPRLTKLMHDACVWNACLAAVAQANTAKGPKIQTEVRHSISKNAWNVCGVTLGATYKIARCPYHITGNNEKVDQMNRTEAFEHATFISDCFNLSNKTK